MGCGEVARIVVYSAGVEVGVGGWGGGANCLRKVMLLRGGLLCGISQCFILWLFTLR